MLKSASHLLHMVTTEPTEAVYQIVSRVAPSALTKHYIRHCSNTGLTGPAFVLSFDCDTKKDIRVVSDVHKRLTDMGIMPVYAVPGMLLHQGEDVYGQLSTSGAEFINHGYAEHCQLLDDDVTYESSFFYDQLPRETVRNDILQGDATIREILGIIPKGFRTPHFGTFQSQGDLRYLHNILRELDYTFSTSTAPLAGLRWGPASHRFGLMEIPVSGCPEKPLRILDSWSFRFAPGRKDDGADYIRHVEQMKILLDEGNPYLVNIYADPSQVHDWNDFFVAMKSIAKYNVSSYSELLGMLS